MKEYSVKSFQDGKIVTCVVACNAEEVCIFIPFLLVFSASEMICVGARLALLEEPWPGSS